MGVVGVEEGEFTFTGRKGNTVIDYVLGDEEMKERVVSLKIGERIDSDHQPVVVRIKKDNKIGMREKEIEGGRGEEFGMKRGKGGAFHFHFPCKRKY